MLPRDVPFAFSTGIGAYSDYVILSPPHKNDRKSESKPKGNRPVSVDVEQQSYGDVPNYLYVWDAEAGEWHAGDSRSGRIIAWNVNPLVPLEQQVPKLAKSDVLRAIYDGAFRPGVEYWSRAIVTGDNFGGYLVAAIEGAGSGIYSNKNPNGFGAMTIGTGQLVLAIGVSAKGVLTGNSTLIVLGVGMYGAGTTNFVGGVMNGPEFELPLSPNGNINDWTNWTVEWWASKE